MIHSTDLVANQTVKAHRHLPMNPSCRTRERPVATNKLKEWHGSCAARLQQLCFTTIQLLWIAMMMMKMMRPKFKIQDPRQRLLNVSNSVWRDACTREVLYLLLQPCRHPACWACSSSNNNQDSNPGFSQIGTIHSCNGACKIIQTRISFSFRNMGAVSRRPVWKQGVRRLPG